LISYVEALRIRDEPMRNEITKKIEPMKLDVIFSIIYIYLVIDSRLVKDWQLRLGCICWGLEQWELSLLVQVYLWVFQD
jgi:hypothetical protein